LDSSGKQRWFMLSMYHPTAAFHYKCDIKYKSSAPRVKRVMAAAQTFENNRPRRLKPGAAVTGGQPFWSAE